MSTRGRIMLVLSVCLVAALALVAWQQEQLRRAWWDSLAARGPDAEALGRLEACEGLAWTGWVTVVAGELALPCGEPLGAELLATRLNPALRRAWLREQLERTDLSIRARWRITRALELAGAELPEATVSMAVDGLLDEALVTELLLADGGPQTPREHWVASRLRAVRGASPDAYPWRQVVDGARLAGKPSLAVAALRASLRIPQDVDPRLHGLPEAWAHALAPALACDPMLPSCLDRWVASVEAVLAAPEGEAFPVHDLATDEDAPLDVGLLGPILAYEGVDQSRHDAVARLLDDQAAMGLDAGRPWLGIGRPGAAADLPEALWTGRMGPWTQALWARELARRAEVDGWVRRTDAQLVVTLADTTRSLCGRGAADRRLQAVLDEEIVARALRELHPGAVAAAARLAGWAGPEHALFGSAGEQTEPPDPCKPLTAG